MILKTGRPACHPISPGSLHRRYSVLRHCVCDRATRSDRILRRARGLIERLKLFHRLRAKPLSNRPCLSRDVVEFIAFATASAPGIKTKSSTTAAMRGTRSSINPGKSCPSLAAIGSRRSIIVRVGIRSVGKASLSSRYLRTERRMIVESPVEEYHKSARDCLRWAAKARTEEQRKQFLVSGPRLDTSRIANRGGLEEIMNGRTNFAHRIDMWNDDGEDDR